MSQTRKQSILKSVSHIAIAMLISLATMCCLATIVQAESFDFSEGDPTAKGSTAILGGPSWSRSGVIFYLVDEYGKYVGVKPIVYTTGYEGFVDRNGNQLHDVNIRVGARMLTLQPDRIFRGAIDFWGPPWGENGELRGVEIREWLITPESDGHTRAANLIHEMYGKDWALKYENKEVYLVFEAIGWNNVYVGGKNTGVCIAGTSRFWASYYVYLYSQGVTTSKGDPMINLYTHDKYQHCMVLEGEPEVLKMGLEKTPTKSGKQESTFLQHYMKGWGMGVLWCEPNPINTYWLNHSPNMAENPIPDKVGTKNIVKGYYVENETTKVKKSEGVFLRRDTSRIINIMDEPKYEVVQWDMSDKPPTTALDPTNWNPPKFVADYANGKSPATVELPTHAHAPTDSREYGEADKAMSGVAETCSRGCHGAMAHAPKGASASYHCLALLKHQTPIRNPTLLRHFLPVSPV